jgi:hypothetical protein
MEECLHGMLDNAYAIFILFRYCSEISSICFNTPMVITTTITAWKDLIWNIFFERNFLERCLVIDLSRKLSAWDCSTSFFLLLLSCCWHYLC